MSEKNSEIDGLKTIAGRPVVHGLDSRLAGAGLVASTKRYEDAKAELRHITATALGVLIGLVLGGAIVFVIAMVLR